MAVAHVDPEAPDVPLEHVRGGRGNRTFAADPKGQGGYLAHRKWREWFGDHVFEYPPDVDRPVTRADCENAPRPCGFVSCAHHLYLDVNPETGALTINFPDVGVDQMRETCVLDIADRAGITLEEVGVILNLTRERIRQVQERALAKIKRAGDAELGIPADRDEAPARATPAARTLG